MKRTYTDQEMMRILKQELVVPEKVDQGMQEAYRKLGIEHKSTVSFIRKRRLLHVLTAAAIAAVGSSMVVFAANKFLSADLVKEKDSVTYDLAIDREQEAHEVSAEPTYMPEGYTFDGAKWRNDETGGCVSFLVWNAAELDASIRAGMTDDLTDGMKERNLKEEIEINGMKVALFMPDSRYVDSEKNVLNAILFNEEDGYMVEIYNSQLPKEEVVKIAKGLDIRVLDSTVPYKTDAEIETLLAEEETRKADVQEELKPELVADCDFFSTGTELKIPFTEADKMLPDDLRYTVESIEIKDSLPVSEFPAENYADYEGELADWLNEDGTLKPHERYKYTYDENGNTVGVPTLETVNSKFVVAHMKLKNNDDHSNDCMVYPAIEYLDMDGNDIYRSFLTNYQYDHANENYHLQTDGFPIYFDQSYYTDGIKRIKDFLFVPLEPGEELEYTLVYVVDEDRLDNTFFLFYPHYYGPGQKHPVESENKYVYVKVKQ